MGLVKRFESSGLATVVTTICVSSLCYQQYKMYHQQIPDSDTATVIFYVDKNVWNDMKDMMKDRDKLLGPISNNQSK